MAPKRKKSEKSSEQKKKKKTLTAKHIEQTQLLRQLKKRSLILLNDKAYATYEVNASRRRKGQKRQIEFAVLRSPRFEDIGTKTVPYFMNTTYKCVDLTEVKDSTIENGGRGLFAKKNFEPGELIVEYEGFYRNPKETKRFVTENKGNEAWLAYIWEVTDELSHLPKKDQHKGWSVDFTGEIYEDYFNRSTPQELKRYIGIGGMSNTKLDNYISPEDNENNAITVPFIGRDFFKAIGYESWVDKKILPLISGEKGILARNVLRAQRFGGSSNMRVFLVATKRIREGDEIFNDYGPHYEPAWVNAEIPDQPEPREPVISIEEAKNGDEDIKNFCDITTKLLNVLNVSQLPAYGYDDFRNTLEYILKNPAKMRQEYNIHINTRTTKKVIEDLIAKTSDDRKDVEYMNIIYETYIELSHGTDNSILKYALNYFLNADFEDADDTETPEIIQPDIEPQQPSQLQPYDLENPPPEDNDFDMLDVNNDNAEQNDNAELLEEPLLQLYNNIPHPASDAWNNYVMTLADKKVPLRLFGGSDVLEYFMEVYTVKEREFEKTGDEDGNQKFIIEQLRHLILALLHKWKDEPYIVDPIEAFNELNDMVNEALDDNKMSDISTYLSEKYGRDLESYGTVKDLNTQEKAPEVQPIELKSPEVKAPEVKAPEVEAMTQTLIGENERIILWNNTLSRMIRKTVFDMNSSFYGEIIQSEYRNRKSLYDLLILLKECLGFDDEKCDQKLDDIIGEVHNQHMTALSRTDAADQAAAATLIDDFMNLFTFNNNLTLTEIQQLIRVNNTFNKDLVNAQRRDQREGKKEAKEVKEGKAPLSQRQQEAKEILMANRVPHVIKDFHGDLNEKFDVRFMFDVLNVKWPNIGFIAFGYKPFDVRIRISWKVPPTSLREGARVLLYIPAQLMKSDEWEYDEEQLSRAEREGLKTPLWRFFSNKSMRKSFACMVTIDRVYKATSPIPRDPLWNRFTDYTFRSAEDQKNIDEFEEKFRTGQEELGALQRSKDIQQRSEDEIAEIDLKISDLTVRLRRMKQTNDNLLSSIAKNVYDVKKNHWVFEFKDIKLFTEIEDTEDAKGNSIERIIPAFIDAFEIEPVSDTDPYQRLNDFETLDAEGKVVSAESKLWDQPEGKRPLMVPSNWRNVYTHSYILPTQRHSHGIAQNMWGPIFLSKTALEKFTSGDSIKPTIPIRRQADNKKMVVYTRGNLFEELLNDIQPRPNIFEISIDTNYDKDNLMEDTQYIEHVDANINQLTPEVLVRYREQYPYPERDEGELE